MKDPEKNVVDLVTEILKSYQESGGNSPLLMGFIDQKQNVEIFAYSNCSYADLRRLATAIQDEATLKMIAVNTDRLERFKEEAEGEEP